MALLLGDLWEREGAAGSLVSPGFARGWYGSIHQCKQYCENHVKAQAFRPIYVKFQSSLFGHKKTRLQVTRVFWSGSGFSAVKPMPKTIAIANPNGETILGFPLTGCPASSASAAISGEFITPISPDTRVFFLVYGGYIYSFSGHHKLFSLYGYTVGNSRPCLPAMTGNCWNPSY